MLVFSVWLLPPIQHSHLHYLYKYFKNELKVLRDKHNLFSVSA